MASLYGVNKRYVIFGVILFAFVAFAYFVGQSGKEGFQSADGVNTFALYYAKWCPHCKDVKPVFEKWGGSKGSVQVNGKPVFVKLYEESADKDKMAGKPVRGYPTFLLEKADGTIKESNEERTPEGWMKFLKQNV